MQFTGLDAAAARAFAERWLPTWTGNDSERLAAFYSEDTFYCDPAIPAGVRGRDALLLTFEGSSPEIRTGCGRTAARYRWRMAS